MANEIKVPVAPEATADESLIENPREKVEQAIVLENETPTVQIPDEVLETKEEVKEVKEEVVEDPLERIKKSVQKRIDKVVAQKKTAEEELAEARLEIERLKSKPAEIVSPKDDNPPTPEQVEAYILKMREEGNAKEEIAATRYLIKLEKEMAIKAVKDEQAKANQEAKARADKQLSDWTNLNKDYVVYTQDGKPDIKSDLSLGNQNGLLYKTALSLYQDKDLHADFYNDPDTIQGFRRAVSDAYREIHQQGLLKTPKEGVVETLRKVNRQVLADPDATDADETPTQSTQADLSDADKVREEIKQRNKMRNSRKVSH